MLIGALMVLAPGAGALDADIRKVTICHRTNSVSSPYVVNTVSYNGANGEFVQGPNHYEHLGDIFDVDADPATAYPPPRKGDQWGDIIPPVPYGDGLMTEGLNWSAEGQAIYYGKTDHGPDDPALCTTPVAPPLTYTATLAKTNNADGLTDYSADETAAAAGVDVPFKVVIANTGSGDLTVAELTDTWTDQSLDLLGLGDDLDCTIEGVEEDDAPALFSMEDGVVIPAGAAVTCYFTVEDYSPVADGSVTNTVTLETEEAEDVIGTSIVRTPATTPTYSATIAKANDADGNGTYTGDETGSPGADVPFQIVISNTGTGDLEMVTLTDTWPTDNSLDLLGEGVLACGEGEAVTDLNVGDTLAAGDSMKCSFTVAGYGPAAGTSVTNTVMLTTDQTGPDTATSIVRIPGPTPTFTHSIGVDKQNDADGDDDFSNFENAAAEGDDVEFEIVIESRGTGAVTLTTLTDTFDGEVVDLLTDVDLSCLRGVTTVTLAVGSVLPANSTTVCQFTLEDYAPAAGESLSNVVEVDTMQTGPATDGSTVAVAAVLPEATGTVTLVKEVTGDLNADWSFDFTGALGAVTLTDEVPETPSTAVDAGTYSIVEDIGDLGTGWAFDDATCVDQAGVVVGDGDEDGSVDFVVAPNADVTCTFVNAYEAPTAQVIPDAVTPAAEVKGDVITRTLPRTGEESKGLAGAGVLLVALGAALVLGSKRQLAQR